MMSFWWQALELNDRTLSTLEDIPHEINEQLSGLLLTLTLHSLSTKNIFDHYVCM